MLISCFSFSNHYFLKDFFFQIHLVMRYFAKMARILPSLLPFLPVSKYKYVPSFKLLIGWQRNVDSCWISFFPDEPLFIIVTWGPHDLKHRVCKGVITSPLVLCILKRSLQSQSKMWFYINKTVSGFELPHNNTCCFPTLEISSGTASPYYPYLKRSELSACKSKPLLDRASGLLLVVLIKFRVVFSSRTIPGRLKVTPHSGSPLCCWLRTACWTGWEEDGNKVQLCTEGFQTHLSSLWDSVWDM